MGMEKGSPGTLGRWLDRFACRPKLQDGCYLYAFSAGFVLLACVAFAAYRSAVQFTDYSKWMAHANGSVQRVQAALSVVKDAEIAWRGYLYSDHERYRNRYLSVSREIPAELASLREDLDHHPEQRASIDELVRRIDAKLAHHRQLLEAPLARSREQRLLDLDQSRHDIIAIREAGQAIEAEEQARVTSLLRAAEGSARRYVRITLLAGALALLLVTAAMAVVFRDLRRRARAQRELAAARDEADRASRAKSEFLAKMSHEIRTPLNAIVGIADVLDDSRLDDEQRRHVQVFRTAGLTLSHLINDILDLSKVEAGRLELDEHVYDPRALVAGCVELLELKSSRKGLRLEARVAPEVPARLRGDAARVRQVLLNLIGNAVKFTHRGEVVIEAGVDLGEGGVGARLRVSVRDTGIGMTSEQLARAFTLFGQADREISSQYGGTGLGLTISRQLVELMGGRLDASSEPGQGSTFRFELPLRPASVPAADVKPASEAPARMLRILLADDSADNRLLIRAYLRGQGHELVEVENGDEAARRFGESRFDLVLMDLHMPVLDGYAATRRIRELEARLRLPRTPILAVTAYAMDGDEQESLRAGCDRHLTKPIRRETLLGAIAEATRGPAAGSAAEPALDAPAR